MPIVLVDKLAEKGEGSSPSRGLVPQWAWREWREARVQVQAAWAGNAMAMGQAGKLAYERRLQRRSQHCIWIANKAPLNLGATCCQRSLILALNTSSRRTCDLCMSKCHAMVHGSNDGKRLEDMCLVRISSKAIGSEETCGS